MRADTEHNKLRVKYMNDPAFQAEVDGSFAKYQIIIQEAEYSDLSQVNEDLFIRFDRVDQEVYFYFGCYHDTEKASVHKIAMYFLKNFNPNPKREYTFVYINNKAKSDVYGQVKEIFLQLTLDHFILLRNFIIVKPSFYNVAQDFIAFNTIPCYLKSKTKQLNSCKELCSYLKINEQDFVDVAPQQIIHQEFPNLKPRQLRLEDQRINFQGQVMNQQQKQSRVEFQKTMKSFLFVKPGKETHNIQDYEIGKLGIPVVLEMLIFYFKSNPEGLRVEGLFRKSVSIDEQNQTLTELANKNYDCLLKITNPHIVANLIKRFFSNLKTPIVPYSQFETLMHDQGVKDKRELVKNVISTLPSLNFISLMYLLDFLNHDVISNQAYNKMTAQNISICFSPCLLRAEKASSADLIYASKCAMVTKIMLDDFDYVFGNSAARAQMYRASERHKIKQFQQQLQNSVQCERKSRISGRESQDERPPQIYLNGQSSSQVKKIYSMPMPALGSNDPRVYQKFSNNLPQYQQSVQYFQYQQPYQPTYQQQSYQFQQPYQQYQQPHFNNYQQERQEDWLHPRAFENQSMKLKTEPIMKLAQNADEKIQLTVESSRAYKSPRSAGNGKDYL